MTTVIGSEEGQIRQILLLRTIICMVGERTTPPWWRTQFLTDVGLRALTRIFPRTAASAALSSVLIAARVEHDKRIGLGGRYHLFRLPANLEHGVALLMTQEAFATQTGALVSKGPNDLIHDLAVMAHGRKEITADGPIRLGSRASITQPISVDGLAAHYCHSFETNRRVFPYFEGSDGRP
jgi:hypothetical protein